jgi:tetratricopeptide (TPR) repeat protein
MTTAPAPQGLTIEQALAQAHAHWEAGQTNQAEILCQQVLALWPGQSDALHLMGLMAHSFGNLDLAIEQLRKACQAPRAPAAYLSNLAEMLRQKGQLVEAEQAGRRAVTMEPGFVAAWNNLGIILQEAGKLDESLACLNRVVQLRPEDPLARNNLGNTFKRLGRLADAREQYEVALQLEPRYAEALSNLATLLGDLGEPDLALQTARRAIDVNPRLADAYINAAGIETGRRNYLEALRWTEALLSFAPMHPGGLTTKASVLKHLDRYDEALATARQAVSAAPDSSEALNAMGEAYQGLGQIDQALDAFAKAGAASGFAAEKALVNRGVAMMERGSKADARTALEAALVAFPQSASAWMAISDIKKFPTGDPGLEQMEALLRPGGVESRADRLAMHFALGKAWMDAGEAEKAFAHLNAGNQAQRATFAYDSAATVRWLDSIPAAFPPALFKKMAKAGAPSEAPVFVIGMPRSGTTLVEQILASHPKVHGAGELSMLHRLGDSQGSFPGMVANLTPEVARQLGEAYLAEIERLAPGSPRVVDKMPSNFIMAGLIPLILPQARIIHVRRDPVDTCLSGYTKLFAKEQLFTYDLKELGEFHRAYQGLMDYWRTVLPPKRFTEVAYEDVVSDLEGQARRLIDFIGLEWDDACLSFDKTKRLVRTASVNQVREPIFKTSVGRWKPYAKQLEPLLEALGVPAP